MFVDFFNLLRAHGIPVSPTSFLRLHKAMHTGSITSLDDFYTGARTILVKHERYFDRYDQLFAHYFRGVDLEEPQEYEFMAVARAMLEEWLADPAAVARELGVNPDALSKLSPEELVNYFLERLREQTGEHHGGSRWIGTGGTSPVGHGGYHPGGMRVGGTSRNRSAVKVAMDRRYKDYALQGPMTTSQIGEALKRLRHMVPTGPKDRINVDATIYETMKKAGEIEIVYDRDLRDRLKIILAIDNGGWSMDPHIELVQTLFHYARSQFKDLRTFYFHNTVYENFWEDPTRYLKPVAVDDLIRIDPETKFIIVGDASMAPYELTAPNGVIYFESRSGKPSIDRLRFIAETFPHAVWINPVPQHRWHHTYTIRLIEEVFPMFELTLEGLEAAVAHMMRK